jgi:hypothetical protein
LPASHYVKVMPDQIFGNKRLRDVCTCGIPGEQIAKKLA